jgi:mycothiol synthase
MSIEQRLFSGEPDVAAMLALARATAADNVHVVDLPYRLSSWALDDPHNVGLWVDADGRLLAWAVMQTPFWTIDHAYLPDAAPDLHRTILAWADERAHQLLGTRFGLPCWFASAFAGQEERIRDLEGAGFACQANVGQDSWSKVLLRRPAGMPVADDAPPAGFSIRPLAGEAEVEAYVHLHRAVFESKNMTVPWRRRTLQRPECRPDLDLVAVAPDGRLAAFCICWLDRRLEPPRGQIEPLGVHDDFRGLGLGRAILSEGLRRLHLAGAEEVVVETDLYRNPALALYKALGFRPVRDVLVYRKVSSQ